MPHTSGVSWPKTEFNLFSMPLHYEKNGKIHGFPSARIRCILDEEPAKRNLWALNTIEPDKGYPWSSFSTSTEVGLVATVLVNPDLLRQSRVLRKEVLAKEFLEIVCGLNDPEKRRKRRSVLNNIDAVTAVSSEGDRTTWEDTDEERTELQAGLHELLLSFDSISKFLQRSKGLNRNTFIAAVNQSPEQKLISHTSKELADEFVIRETIAHTRLVSFLNPH